MSVNKRIVEHGSAWADDEEEAAAEAYRSKLPFNRVMMNFPTDRSRRSVWMKMGNHRWEDTNGQSGLSGGNNWVKAHWTARRNKVDLDAMLKEEERLEKEKGDIMKKWHEVNDKQSKLKEARLLAAEKELTKEEEKELRDALKVCEALMSVKNVDGYVRLRDEEPNNSAYERRKFEIETNTKLKIGHRGVETTMWVFVTTKHPKVCKIVREVFDFEEPADKWQGDWGQVRQ
jgi:hypothetical protein